MTQRIWRSKRLAARLCMLTAFAIALCFALPAFAQDDAPTIYREGEGLYFSTLWLFLLVLFSASWMGTFDWVGKDCENLRGRRGFWCSILISIGGVAAILMLLVHMAFVVVGLVAQYTAFGLYVWKRNLGLPPERRVLTPTHFKYLWRVFMERLHVGKKAGAVLQAKDSDRLPEIILLRKDGKTLENLTETRSEGTSDAVIQIKALIESAVLSRVTDIHIEPKQDEVQARFRIDGILHNVPSYPPELGPPIVSAVKVLSDMDIAEKRKPQDGTFMGRLGDKNLDFRVATSPSVHGETLVMRILDRSVGLLTLEDLGMPENCHRVARRVIQHPNGMLISSGPTGSGKTTTLYSMLSQLDAFQKNIVTIENPIEYRLDNINQTQVNTKAGVTFASALRSFLRQDPDVIMVGEIRDAETASVALQAAMTGHFVFTTIHANDSITTLFRLLDLGVEPYLISSSLTAVLAQRLLRVLCAQCRVPYEPDPKFLKKIGVKPREDMHLFKAEGCEACQGTGYKGRVGLFEVLEINDPIKELIRTNPSIQLIKAEARKNKWRTLQEAGLTKVLEGQTSLKELVRVTK